MTLDIVFLTESLYEKILFSNLRRFGSCLTFMGWIQRSSGSGRKIITYSCYPRIGLLLAMGTKTSYSRIISYLQLELFNDSPI